MSFPIVYINTLSLAMILGVIVIAWRKRNQAGVSELFVASLFMLVWSVGSFGEMLFDDLAPKILWRDITQVGTFYVPVASLLFALSYTGLFQDIPKQTGRLLYGLQTASILFIVTDRWHHLARAQITLIDSALIVDSTPIAKVLVSLNFVYATLAIATIVLFLIGTEKPLKKQAYSVLIGMLIPLVYALAKVSTGGRFIHRVPISGVFALSDCVILLGIVHYHLLLMASTARSEAFRIIDDGILIATTQGRIVDANPAMLDIFSRETEFPPGSPDELERIIRTFFRHWHEAIVAGAPGTFSLAVGIREKRYYQCEIYALRSQKEKLIGSISVLTDMTEQQHQHDRLQNRAEHDDLTGLYNRRAFIERVEKQLQANRRPSCLAFIDIDHFKAVNDRYGHLCGDAILREFSTYLTTANLQVHHLAGRIGGEEFALFLQERDETNRAVIEELRRRIDAHTFLFEDHPVHITISIGAANGNYRFFDPLYRIADAYLYKAKEAGRNCIRYYRDEDDQGQT